MVPRTSAGCLGFGVYGFRVPRIAARALDGFPNGFHSPEGGGGPAS